MVWFWSCRGEEGKKRILALLAWKTLKGVYIGCDSAFGDVVEDA